MVDAQTVGVLVTANVTVTIRTRILGALASGDDLNLLFIAWAFFYLIVFMIHFTIRKLFFESRDCDLISIALSSIPRECNSVMING